MFHRTWNSTHAHCEKSSQKLRKHRGIFCFPFPFFPSIPLCIFLPFFLFSYLSHSFLFSYFFFPKKGSLISEIKKNGWTKDSKKINIFEIGSLEVYDRGGGCPGSTLYYVLTCMYLCVCIIVRRAFFT